MQARKALAVDPAGVGWGFSLAAHPTLRCCPRANSNPDQAAAKRAFKAMMTMRKIDISQIEAAERGSPSMRKITNSYFQSLNGVMQAHQAGLGRPKTALSPTASDHPR